MDNKKTTKCICCDGPVIKITREIESEIKNKMVKYKEELYYCINEDEYFETYPLAKQNYENALNAYKNKYENERND